MYTLIITDKYGDIVLHRPTYRSMRYGVAKEIESLTEGFCTLRVLENGEYRPLHSALLAEVLRTFNRLHIGLEEDVLTPVVPRVTKEVKPYLLYAAMSASGLTIAGTLVALALGVFN